MVKKRFTLFLNDFFDNYIFLHRIFEFRFIIFLL
jgi:hypothetical protein